MSVKIWVVGRYYGVRLCLKNSESTKGYLDGPGTRGQVSKETLVLRGLGVQTNVWFISRVNKVI